jgi:galactose mutarotase-like enzyme
MEYRIENDHLVVKIKSKGAELFSIEGTKTQREYLWGADPAFWGKTSPVLFPIVGTLIEDTYYYKDKPYSLTRHGFARDEEFTVEEQDKTSITFLLSSTPASLAKYPFNFELRIRYEVREQFLYTTYTVDNTGKEEMYFSLGAHPAFKVPLTDNLSYNDYFLEFSKKEDADRWPINKDGLIEDDSRHMLDDTSRLPLTHELFYNEALVFKDLNSDVISLRSTKDTHGFDFHFKGFPFMGIWAAKNADFVCIEPWCGIADSVDHNQQLVDKEGIEQLEPGDSWVEGWKVKFY